MTNPTIESQVKMEYGWNFSISGLKMTVKSGLEKIFLKLLHIKWIYLIERRNFYQMYKFSNKNDMVSAWRNFKNIFSRPLFTIIFRPEMLKFHPYSILTGQTMVRYVIYCVLKNPERKCHYLLYGIVFEFWILRKRFFLQIFEKLP